MGRKIDCVYLNGPFLLGKAGEGGRVDAHQPGGRVGECDQ